MRRWNYILSILVFTVMGWFVFHCNSELSLAKTKKRDPVEGRKIYRSYCTSCHGYFGKGDGPLADYVEIAPRDHTDARRMNARTDENLFATIHDGGPVNEFSVNMPLWRSSLTDDQMKDVVIYLRTIHLAPSDLFPDGEIFTHKLVTLDLVEVSEKLGESFEGWTYNAYLYLYLPSKNNKLLGVVSFNNFQMPSENTVNVGIGIDNEGKIVKLTSVEELEELGTLTGEFFDQFKGFGKDSLFEVGRDVKVVSGSEEVTRDFTHQVKKLYLLTWYAYKHRGELETP